MSTDGATSSKSIRPRPCQGATGGATGGRVGSRIGARPCSVWGSGFVSGSRPSDRVTDGSTRTLWEAILCSPTFSTGRGRYCGEVRSIQATRRLRGQPFFVDVEGGGQGQLVVSAADETWRAILCWASMGRRIDVDQQGCSLDALIQ